METGTKKLSQLYTKLVAEGSSGIPPNGPEFELQAFPSNLFSELLPIVNFLRTLPLPPTHPSHPAAPVIQATLKEAQKGYADMRGSWCLKCLEMYGKRIVERAETLDGVVAGRELGKWVDNLLFIVQVCYMSDFLSVHAIDTLSQLEYKLLTELAPLPAQSNIESTFLTLVTPLMNLFTATTSSLSSLIKRSLLKNTFLALSATSNLAVLQTKWDEIIVRRTGKKENELKDSINTIRSSCLRSFPEFIADIRAAALGKGGEFSTGLADFTLSVSIYGTFVSNS